MKIKDQHRISENSLFDVFERLKKDRVILKVNFIGRDFEGLTIITGVDNAKKNPMFLIDYPGNDREIFEHSEGGRLFFEYSDYDNLQYSFRSLISRIQEDNIRLYFPEFVERMQRRSHFRAVPPMGTIILFKIGGNRFEGNVVNISESGALVNHALKNYNKSWFFKGVELDNLQILCDDKRIQTRISISKAEIKRLEKRAEKDRFQYALRFLDAKKKDQEMLRSFIYDCQREELRRRSRLSGI